MTFSIVAYEERTGQLGVAAMTPYLAYDGLALMAEGRSALEALREVVDADPGRDFRQCGMVDARGRAAAWTGSETPGWSGHLEGDACMAQGNRLVGPETLEAVVDAYGKRDDLELAMRLLVALEAGESTGADKQGELSGTISVMDTEEYPLWDLRVDHAEDPAAALRDLYGEFAERLVPQIRKLSTRDDPMGEAAREQSSIG